MAIELRSLPRFTFPSHSGGPQSQVLTVAIPTLRNAAAVINGFSIGFTNGDHQLYRKEVNIVAQVVGGDEGPEVIVRVNFALRDKSGNFDDAFNGFVDVLLIVDRE
jgi:hypothetical protein